MTTTRKAQVYGSQFPSGGLGTTLSYSAREQTMIAAVQPSHWIDAKVRTTEGSRMVLIDRITGTRYLQAHTSDPTVTTGIGGRATLEMNANSYFLPQEGQKTINPNAWSLVFVCSNLGAGATTRTLMGTKPEGPHAAADEVPYVGLASGVRPRIYTGSATLRLEVSSAGDLSGSERCIVIGFDTTNGLKIQVDGVERASAPADVDPLDFGRFVLFAGTNSTPGFTLPFYGEWAMTLVTPYNLLAASGATALTALETFVNAECGIVFT